VLQGIMPESPFNGLFNNPHIKYADFTQYGGNRRDERSAYPDLIKMPKIA